MFDANHAFIALKFRLYDMSSDDELPIDWSSPSTRLKLRNAKNGINNLYVACSSSVFVASDLSTDAFII